MVKIEINGTPIEARDGSMVIEAADEAGIVIPRFCYHKKLSIAANCRMCLVEVEKMAKALPACATPVTDGMKVYTRSPKALAAQQAVLEFLLINHPLDCPICDQGGECDLQEMAMGFGQSLSRYGESKRIVPENDLGPLIATDMTRCIHCTRCVRFGQEIAGIMELGGTGRGEHTRIGTYIANSVDSELSGNVIDLCPVGALTAKPSRYTARPWELQRHAAISPHDAVGSNLWLEQRQRQLLRVVPREHDQLNENWLSDRDRFSYSALNHPDRLTAPQIRRGGEWQSVGWDEALTFAAEQLQSIRQQQGGDRIGALAGYNNSCEEYYLLQKLLRGIGSNHIDHRLRQQDFRGQAAQPPFPWLGMPIEAINQLQRVLLIGGNLRKDQPLLAQRLRQAVAGGAAVMQINPVDYDLAMPLTASRVVAPNALHDELVTLAAAIYRSSGARATPELAALLDDATVTEAQQVIADQLLSGAAGSKLLLLGQQIASHPQRAELVALADAIAAAAGATLGILPEGGNGVGAALAGALPHRSAGAAAVASVGLDWLQMIATPRAGWLLHGVEPDLDSLDGERLTAALEEGFTIALTSYRSAALERVADVLLPVALWPEQSGSHVNSAGDWQLSGAALLPPGEARPAWKVLRVLGNLLAVAGFDYLTVDEVRQELQQHCDGVVASSEQPWVSGTTAAPVTGLQRISDWSIYAVDAMVRRAAPLQATADATLGRTLWLHPDSAAEAGVADKNEVTLRAAAGERVTLPLRIDARVAPGCALLGSGVSGVPAAGSGFATVQIEKA